jgi:hypothetical protein
MRRGKRTARRGAPAVSGPRCGYRQFSGDPRRHPRQHAQPHAAHAWLQQCAELRPLPATRDHQHLVVTALQVGLLGMVFELGRSRVVEQDVGNAHAGRP